MPRKATATPTNLSLSRSSASAWRRSQRHRTHEQLHDASDYIRTVNVDASGFARLWIGVGLQIAAEILDEMAAEILVQDIIKESVN